MVLFRMPVEMPRVAARGSFRPPYVARPSQLQDRGTTVGPFPYLVPLVKGTKLRVHRLESARPVGAQRGR